MWHLTLILGLMSGSVIGLPPVLNFGSDAIKAKVVPDVLSGKKKIALAISEAFAGSDVAGLRCSAKKTEDGKFWIINGTKKVCLRVYGFQKTPLTLLLFAVDHERDLLSLLHCRLQDRQRADSNSR